MLYIAVIDSDEELSEETIKEIKNTFESWGGDDVKCVNLRTEGKCLFLINSKVEKLDAKLAVVGKGERT